MNTYRYVLDGNTMIPQSTIAPVPIMHRPMHLTRIDHVILLTLFVLACLVVVFA